MRQNPFRCPWPVLAAPVAAALLMAAAPAIQRGLPASFPAEMDQAQSDYVENCGGCHGVKGDAAPADLPNLQGRVGWFMCTAEGRDYLTRLPNIARSRIVDNAQLADLMNFMVFGLGGSSAPANTRPFTADELAVGRPRAFTSVSLVQVRARLVEKLIRKCGAPASLRLMYAGQPPALAQH